MQLARPRRIVIDVFGPRPGERRERDRAPTRCARARPRRLPMDLRPVRVGRDRRGPRRPRSRRDRSRRPAREGRDAGARRRRCGRACAARGFEVVLTRERDRTLRWRSARRSPRAPVGDLFVSVHANAVAARAAAGVETFTLDENPSATACASRRARTACRAARSTRCSGLLARLRVSEAVARSSRSAEQVHQRDRVGHAGRVGRGERSRRQEGAVLRAVPLGHAGDPGRSGLPHQPGRGAPAARSATTCARWPRRSRWVSSASATGRRPSLAERRR